MASSCSGNILVKTKKTWTINGEKGMRGTVEETTDGLLLWKITAPILQPPLQQNLYYGIVSHIPATYVDVNGLDQMAVIDQYGSVILDEGYSAGYGEIYPIASDVTITYPNGSTYTARIDPPKYKCDALTSECIRDDINGTSMKSNCNNICAPIDPTYRESLLTNCTITPTTAKSGDVISVNLTVEPGTKTENYRLKVTGSQGVSGATAPFQIVGTATATPRTITIPYTLPATISYGLKTYTIELILA